MTETPLPSTLSLGSALARIWPFHANKTQSNN